MVKEANEIASKNANKIVHENQINQSHFIFSNTPRYLCFNKRYFFFDISKTNDVTTSDNLYYKQWQ